jgi:hypothetical protein
MVIIASTGPHHQPTPNTMNTSILVLLVIVATYILYPGFYTNLGDLAVLGWKYFKLETQRYVLLWGMRRQLEKDRKDLEQFLKEFTSDQSGS